MAVTIDGNDLWMAYNVKVERVRGHLNTLERKGETEYSWPDSDGVEAFTEETDIYFKERPIFLYCVLIASTKTEFLAKLNSLKQLLESAGTHTLYLSYTGQSFTVYYPGGDNIDTPRNWKATKIYSRFTLKFIEKTPARAT